jgi:hypothetical protein
MSLLLEGGLSSSVRLSCSAKVSKEYCFDIVSYRIKVEFWEERDLSMILINAKRKTSFCAQTRMTYKKIGCIARQ